MPRTAKMVSTARQRPWRIALVASLALARAACPPPERVSAAVDALLAAPVEREAPSRDVDDVAREPVQRVHPKIARARAAMLTNREKRRRVQELIRTPMASSSRPSPRGAFDSSEPEAAAPGPAAGDALDLLDDDDDCLLYTSPSPRDS